MSAFRRKPFLPAGFFRSRSFRLRTFSFVVLVTFLPLQAQAEVFSFPLGQFETIRGEPGVVIGVPHGVADRYTDVIGYALALRTGAGAVIASRFCCRWTGNRRINVNRPTERSGVPPSLELLSDRAMEVYNLYLKFVREAAQGPLRLYWEIHGNNRAESAGQIEVATVGVGEDLAREIKESYFPIRDSVLATNSGMVSLDLKIEPLDQVHFAARSAKRWKVFQEAAMVLQVELPRSVRRRSAAREAYIRIVSGWMSAVMKKIDNTGVPLPEDPGPLSKSAPD